MKSPHRIRLVIPAILILGGYWRANVFAETAGRVVGCPKVTSGPTPAFAQPATAGGARLDGSLADPVWAAVQPLTGFSKVGGGPAEAQTEVRACYDDQMLYLVATCQEPDVSKIHAQMKERDDDMRQDDCIEFTIGTQSGRMYHIVVSAGGGLYDAWIDPGGWTDVSWDSGARFAVRVFEKAWGVEISIPLKRLCLEPTPGTVVSLHVLRYRKQSGEVSTLVPAPTDSVRVPTAIVKLRFETGR